MGKHTNKIWRTVVFSGAMLVTPVVVGCGGGSKKQEPVTPVTQPADDTAAKQQDADASKAEADAAAANAEEKRLAAEKAEADAKAAEEIAAKAEADKKAADEQAAKDAAAAKKPRPRTTTKSRPTGRGFILS